MKRISPRWRSFAAHLLGNQSDAEQRLWEEIRDGQIKGWKFRRQHPIGRSIVDFCCLEWMLIIELDDEEQRKQETADEESTNYLTALGFRVLRFLNDDVLNKTDDVVEEIVRVMENSENLHSPPSPVMDSELSPGREMDPEDSHSRTFSNQEKVPLKARGSKLDFRMPAEWERHEATWLGWPHNTKDWPGKMGAISWVYGEMVRKISGGETVRILVNDKDHELKARRVLAKVGVDMTRIQFFRVPTNRGWARDFGPIFVKRDQPEPQVAIARFRFTAWAKYPDSQLDDRIPLRLGPKLKIPVVPVERNRKGVVLEGGAIDVNGQGTLLTTEECLLDEQVQVRNPGYSRWDYEEVFRTHLGISQVLWLGQGIAGDDTHGHVDDVCRFVDPYTVVLCQESNPADENYRPLAENAERLEGMRVEDGRKLLVVPLPMPEPLYFEGRRLPASYANFYIGNTVVLVPTFNDPQDRVALGIVADLFPDRAVVGIHAVDLVWGFGTIHCLTQQQPASDQSSILKERS
ncbi:agmatine deiminase family protein [uncultured Nitrospira sp.]|uniref:agmatine deiminase family protein n=1 Tax=uncultured Nitrospira sp. TaxID=157176 RepID=UPI0031406083